MLGGAVSFEAPSGALIACDPLYLRVPKVQSVIRDCVPGCWEAHAILQDRGKDRRHRVWALAVVQADCPVDREALLETIGRGGQPGGFAPERQTVWVDLTSCGFFDSSLADARQGGSAWKGEFAYQCRKLLPQEPPCSAVLPGGAVSASGYGSGHYPCCVRRNGEGRADAAFLRFL